MRAFESALRQIPNYGRCCVLRDSWSVAVALANIDDSRNRDAALPPSRPSRGTGASAEIAKANTAGDIEIRSDRPAGKADAPRPPFDRITIGIHWVTVLIVLALFSSAWLHAYSHDGVHKALLLQIHRSLGVTIWMITIMRLLWRLTHAALPPFPASMSRLHRAFVQMSEYALYALLLVQPVTGMAATLLRGRQFGLFFWHVPPLMPESRTIWISLEGIHEIGACAFGALILGHAAAALFHHFVLRDDVLECMAPVIATAREDALPGRVTDGVAS
jgi:cytochrome b561